VGARSPEQVRENAAAGTLRLGTESMNAIRSCLEEAPHVV
jgi:aryl-alcohol dehydrogenase-like predicted oxidoreductase